MHLIVNWKTTVPVPAASWKHSEVHVGPAAEYVAVIEPGPKKLLVHEIVKSVVGMPHILQLYRPPPPQQHPGFLFCDID